MSTAVKSFKERVLANELVTGPMIFEFFTPGIAAVSKAADADFMLYDMEHSGADIETVKQQVSYCRGTGIIPLLRVPADDYHFIARSLDAGMQGIMVPLVESAAQARDIVSCTQYPPAGRRGAAFGVAHDDYAPGSPLEKIAAAREKTIVITQIETPAGVEAVEEIAATPGVDVIWLGHFDLTNFMGIPGEFENPKFLAAVDRVVAAAQAHGKAAGFMASDDEWASGYYAKGFRMFAYGLDMHLFQRSLKSGIGKLNSMHRSTK